jgi:cysteine synthase
MKAQNILATTGGTPHIRIQKLFGDATQQVWIKSGRNNPGGSIKDRIALAIAQKLTDLRVNAVVLGFHYDTGERYLSVDGFLPA